MSKKVLEFYCVKGKHKVKTSDYKIVTWKNKRKAANARCPDHGIKMFRILGKDADREI